MNRFLSGDMTSLSLTAQYRILKGADWSLEVQHEIATESKDDLSALSFWMESTTTGGRKYEAAVFEIQYRKDKTKVIFLTKRPLNYGPHYASEVEDMKSEALGRLIRQGNKNYQLLDSYAPIIACQAIPVEVREWLLINGADTLGNELKEARRAIRKSIKSGFAAINNKPTGKA